MMELPPSLHQVPSVGDDEQQTSWEQALFRFRRKYGLYEKSPWVNGGLLNLGKLYAVVMQLGGFTAVTEARRWATVGRLLDASSCQNTRSKRLRDFYEKFLLPVELLRSAKRGSEGNDCSAASPALSALCETLPPPPPPAPAPAPPPPPPPHQQQQAKDGVVAVTLQQEECGAATVALQGDGGRRQEEAAACHAPVVPVVDIAAVLLPARHSGKRKAPQQQQQQHGQQGQGQLEGLTIERVCRPRRCHVREIADPLPRVWGASASVAATADGRIEKQVHVMLAKPGVGCFRKAGAGEHVLAEVAEGGRSVSVFGAVLRARDCRVFAHAALPGLDAPLQGLLAAQGSEHRPRGAAGSPGAAPSAAAGFGGQQQQQQRGGRGEAQREGSGCGGRGRPHRPRPWLVRADLSGLLGPGEALDASREPRVSCVRGGGGLRVSFGVVPAAAAAATAARAPQAA